MSVVGRAAAAAVVLTAVFFGGCDVGASDARESSAAHSERGSSARQSSAADAAFSLPQEDPNAPEPPESAELVYFGSRDISEVGELFSKSSGDKVTAVASSYNYIEKLSEMIAADNSPDLCDKTDSTFPYLISKNMYEDLTKYIDTASPQWSEIADTIELYSFLGGHYFYPVAVRIMPQFLMYDKWLFVQNENLPDPEKQWLGSAWTWSAMKQSGSEIISAGNAQLLVSGDAVFDNFSASAGCPLYPRSELSDGELAGGHTTRSFYSCFNTSTADEVVDMLCEFPNNRRQITDVMRALKRSVFLSGDEQTLAELRKNNVTVGIVPYPRYDGEAADRNYYCKAVTEGFLVPKGAKNIQSAASFINFSRIREISDEYAEQRNRKLIGSGLLRSDVEWLQTLRTDEVVKPVTVDKDCFDADANGAVRRILSFVDKADYEQKRLVDQPLIDEGINRIEQML